MDPEMRSFLLRRLRRISRYMTELETFIAEVSWLLDEESRIETEDERFKQLMASEKDPPVDRN
jgi:hypothetical protein